MEIPDLLTGVPLLGADGMPLPGMEDDNAIAAAAGRIRDHCGWHIAPETVETITFDSLPSGVLFLPSLRVTAVTVTVAAAAARISWSPTGRLKLLDHPGGVGLPVVVTFTHGYDTCPPSVRAVVARIAKLGFTPEPQLRSKAKGPFVNAYFEQGDELADVETYRLPVVG